MQCHALVYTYPTDQRLSTSTAHTQVLCHSGVRPRIAPPRIFSAFRTAQPTIPEVSHVECDFFPLDRPLIILSLPCIILSSIQAEDTKRNAVFYRSFPPIRSIRLKLTANKSISTNIAPDKITPGYPTHVGFTSDDIKYSSKPPP